MTILYQPILTHIGFIKSDDEMKKRFTEEVVGMLESGNEGGIGGSLDAQKFFKSIVPFPSDKGPIKFDDEGFFQFKPEINVDFFKEKLKDEEESGNWQNVFVNNLYIKIIKSFDIPGATPFATAPSFLFDAKGIIPGLGFPYVLADLQKSLVIVPTPPDPAGLAATTTALTALGITPAPSLGYTPPIINSSDFDVMPGVKNDLLGLIDEIKELPKSILEEIMKKFLDPLELPKLADPTAIVKMAVEVAEESLLSLFKDFLEEDVIPKVLVSSVLVLLKEIICVIVVVVIGSLVGSGDLTKKTAKLIGLI